MGSQGKIRARLFSDIQWHNDNIQNDPHFFFVIDDVGRRRKLHNSGQIVFAAPWLYQLINSRKIRQYPSSIWLLNLYVLGRNFGKSKTNHAVLQVH